MARKDWAPISARAAELVDEYDTAVTLRQVHYRLVAEAADTGSGYTNTESDYKNLSRLTAAARRDGTFPALLDRTRTIERAQTWDSPQAALELIARAYRRDLLETHDVLPVIIVEKATLISQIVSWFGGLCVPAVALRGYSSETLERLVLELVDDDHRDIAMFYCGDFDPTGEDIPRAFEANTGLALRRVALTAGQVDEYGLPAAPGKVSDSRATGFELRHGRLVQVELEALDPSDLQMLLANELNQMLDSGLIEAVRDRQEAERAWLTRLTSERDHDA